MWMINYYLTWGCKTEQLSADAATAGTTALVSLTGRTWKGQNSGAGHDSFRCPHTFKQIWNETGWRPPGRTLSRLFDRDLLGSSSSFSRRLPPSWLRDAGSGESFLRMHKSCRAGSALAHPVNARPTHSARSFSVAAFCTSASFMNTSAPATSTLKTPCKWKKPTNMLRPNSPLKYSVHQWYQLPEPTFVPELSDDWISLWSSAAQATHSGWTGFTVSDGSRGF